MFMACSSIKDKRQQGQPSYSKNTMVSKFVHRNFYTTFTVCKMHIVGLSGNPVFEK
jgi:hypothetical protein